MTILYNCHHDGDQYRITKFDDGNPIATYLCTEVECECPAGERPTCRHRQMLATFITRRLVNTHLFLDWDHGSATCDFSGALATLPAATKPALCEDEGCDHFGTPHICIDKPLPATPTGLRRL